MGSGGGATIGAGLAFGAMGGGGSGMRGAAASTSGVGSGKGGGAPLRVARNRMSRSTHMALMNWNWSRATRPVGFPSLSCASRKPGAQDCIRKSM